MIYIIIKISCEGKGEEANRHQCTKDVNHQYCSITTFIQMSTAATVLLIRSLQKNFEYIYLNSLPSSNRYVMYNITE